MALSAEKLKEMEAEMNRFEQEIALPVAFPHHMHHSNLTTSRPVIGAHTYNRIAEQLQKQQLQIEHQAYNLNAMIGMYAEAVIPVDPSDQGLNSLQFIPHQLQMHHTPSDQSMVNMQQSSMDAQSLGDPSMLSAPPPGSMDEMMSSGSSSSYMTTGNYMAGSATSNNVMTTNMRAAEPPSPTPNVISMTPAVYAAPPVKMRKVVEQHTIIVPTKTEQYREIAPPVEPPQVILPPPLPVKKAPTVVPSYEDSYTMSKKKEKERRRRCIRTAGGQTWEDTSLMEWEADDFRIFCGDLGNDVTDEVLTRAFSKYPSFIRSKVIRDKRNNKTKGYGFVSFKDPQDFIKAMREMNGKYVGSRPIKLRKSTWRDRNLDIVRKKHKEKIRLGLR